MGATEKGFSFLTALEGEVQRDLLAGVTYYWDLVCVPYALTDLAKTALDDDVWSRRKIGAVLAERKIRGLKVPILIACNNADVISHPSDDKWATYSIDQLLSLHPKTPLEMIEEALVNLSLIIQHPSQPIGIDQEERWLLYSYDDVSASYMIQQLENLNFVKKYGSKGGKRSLINLYVVEAKGWEKLVALRRSSGSVRQQAFVAMWFHADTQQYFLDGIYPAIEEDGTRCIRIDLKEHNNKVCDEIIAEIRRSRFVVADFTGNRGGVYYEAGYAHGLAIPVIWTVHKSQLNDLHFDTRQYNHIIYETSAELREKLRNRIRATVITSK